MPDIRNTEGDREPTLRAEHVSESTATHGCLALDKIVVSVTAGETNPLVHLVVSLGILLRVNFRIPMCVLGTHIPAWLRRQAWWRTGSKVSGPGAVRVSARLYTAALAFSTRRWLGRGAEWRWSGAKPLRSRGASEDASGACTCAAVTGRCSNQRKVA